MYSSITLLGRISKEINLKYINNSGTALCEFDVAIDRKLSNGETVTDFYPIQIWDEYGENLSKILDKGQLVFIVGSCKNERWKDRENNAHKNFLVIAKFLKIIDYNNNNLCSLDVQKVQSALIESAYEDRTF